jgi:NADH-quinone oxidoreductase subunit L
MLGPLVILAILSVCGGWIGAGRFGAFLAPAVGTHTVEAASNNLEYILSGLAVLVAALGWFIADRMYRARPDSPAKLAASMAGPYNLLVHKYWIDETYNNVIVRPLLALSKFVLDWVVDVAILGGLAWLLAGICNLGGAILQRWQSGNLRSYAAWLAAGAAAVLLFALVQWNTVLAQFGIHLSGAGH